MYRFLLFIFLSILFCNNIYAETIRGCDADAFVSGADKIRFDKVSNAIKYIKFREPEKFVESDLPMWLKGILGAAPNDGFILYQTDIDKIGYVHYRFQQTYLGFPVKNAVYYIHTKDQKIVSVNGDYFPNITLAFENNISQQQAIEIGKQHMPGAYKWDADKFPDPELMVFVKERESYFVYQTDIYTTQPLDRKYLFIDVKEGKVIEEYDRIHHQSVPGKLETRYSGTRYSEVDSISSANFRLRDDSRGNGVYTWDLNESTDYFQAVDFTDNDNCWNTTTNKDDAAYDAHWGTAGMYDYLFDEHGRNSYDNAGATLHTYCHYGPGFNNAFWDGSGLTYGDGNGTTRDPYTSIDVVGHEVMHAVTEYTAGLIYSNEYGALNESFSDIFGVVLDYYKRPNDANFFMGEEFNLEGSMIRDMSNPNTKDDPDTYLGDFWHTNSSDNFGVHTNSGVQNFWYYLLSQGGNGVNDNGDTYSVQGIGVFPAANIAYRNLSVYLTPTSEYADARFYAIEAAIDLHGDCSDEVINTTNAWHAVGVGGIFSNAVVANFQSDITYSCTVPTTIQFNNLSVNGNTYLWDFGDGTTSTSLSPIHTYNSTGVYTVTLTTTGVATCGNSDVLVLTNYLEVTDVGGPATTTCIGSTANPSLVAGIFSFDLLNISNTSNGSVDGFEDYTCTDATNIQEGVFHPVQITTGANEMIGIWADLNNDGLFNNTSEKVYNSPAPATIHNFEMAIPAGATYGIPLRLRIKSDGITTSLDNACANLNSGQTEDYTIIVSENTAAPVANFEAVNPTVLVSSSVQFVDLSANAPTNWSWQFTGGTPSTSTEKNPNIQYNVIGTYPVSLTVSNANGTDAITYNSYVNVTSIVDLCSGPTATNAVSGILVDSGGANGNYSNGENCTLLITPGCAQNITLSFSSFSTEGCCDFLFVYDGVDATAPLLLNAGGYGIPQDVTSSSGEMFIQFTSDFSVTDIGFEATWTSTIPTSSPIANFNTSDINPPVNSDVVFTDQTTNLPNGWFWDFGDGNTSTMQNPVHQFATSGTFQVTLISDNCFALDTVTQIVTVQEMPNITISPTSVFAAIDCGQDTTVEVTISNSGIGDGVYDVLFDSDDFVETSEIFYDFTNVTTHTFTDVFPNTQELSLEVLLNGDFDNSFENASLYIDNTFIELIDDGDVTNGTDIIRNYTFDAATIAPWVSDGIVEVRIENSADVDIGIGGLDVHRVTITAEALNWLIINPTGGVLAPNESTVLTFDLSAANLVEGIYEHLVNIETNDPNLPVQQIPVTLQVLGSPEITFPSPCLGFSNIMQFTSETIPLSISNPGCDTLEITDVIFDNSEFTANINQLTILPFGTDTIMVTFSPVNVGTVNANMSLTNNAGPASVCLTGASFDAPAFSIQPNALDVTLTCGQDTNIIVDMVNSGLGQLTFEAQNVGQSYDETSSIMYNLVTNSTLHVFENISPNSADLNIQVSYSGDFDNTNEFATLFIEGQLIEDIEDMDVSNGTEIIANYSFPSSMSAAWLADGQLEIEIVNSGAVDLNLGGTETHVVHVNSEGIDWLNMSPFNGITPANSSTPTTVTLSSDGLIAGGYNADITVTSNDPNNPSLVLPVNLTVVGTAAISFSMPCVDFPSIMEFTIETLPLVVENTGCEMLNISSIVSGDIVFASNLNQLSIPPYSTDTVLVTFSPMSAGAFSTDLQFTTNVSMATACLTGSSFEAPAISVTPANISINMNSCGDTVTVPITVENIGANNLIYEFLGGTSSSAGSSLDSVKNRLNNSFEEITDLIPNNFEFIDGDIGNNIGDGGGDMYDGGNQLSVNNNFTFLNYSDDLIVSEPLLGSGGQYFTRKHPGLFTFAADINNVSEFNISGNLGADGGGQLEGSILDYTYQGANYKGFVKRVFSAGDPSVNHLVIVKNPPSNANHDFPISTDNDGHNITGIDGVSRIYYLLFAGTSGQMYTDFQFENVMIKFLDLVETGGFADLPTGSFSLGVTESETFDLVFNTDNVAGGVYESLIQISSNDPLNPIIEIPVTINVSFDLCADFSFEQPIACGGQVNFTSLSVNTPSTYLWDFGDGNTSNQMNPTHIYTTPGNYQVTLTISNATSTDMINYNLVIDQTSAPIQACEIVSTNNFPFHEITSFTLNSIQNVSGFEDMSYSDFTCEFQTNLTTGLDYAIELESTTFTGQNLSVYIDYNNNGAFTSDELVFVNNNGQSPHIGIITVPSTATIGVPLRCRAIVDDNFNTISPCVESGQGETEDYTVIIESNMMPPASNFDFTVLDDCQGIIEFHDLSTNIPTSWFWDFGDGTSSGIQNPIHSYNSAGVYTVTLTSTNSFGSSEFTFNITINALNPLIESPLTVFNLNDPIPFTANAPGAISWMWNFGDGTTGNGPDVNHTYTQEGLYTVVLTVTNGVGCVNSTQIVIDVIMVDIDELDPFISVYPNPSRGDFIIENKSGSHYERIEVINTIGQNIYSFEVNSPQEKYPLALGDLPDGVYWLKLKFEDEEVLVKKIAIHKF